MAKLALRNQAIGLRNQGWSYTQIKEQLKVSKSSLSLWLRDMPLSEERIRELRASSVQRIERYIVTRTKQREDRVRMRHEAIAHRLGDFSEREMYILGFALYWAEGTKAATGVVQMTNTDPAMLQFFLSWLDLLGYSRSRVRVHLHLYSDMNIDTATTYWSNTLDIPTSSFRKPYIKETLSDKRKNYKGRFGKGTCVVSVYDQELHDMVLGAIRHFQNQSKRSSSLMGQV